MPVEANPLAVEKLRARTPVGSPLKAADWERVPLALRERAQFSARIESMRFLQRVQNRLESAVSLTRRKEGAFQTREKFVAELQEIAQEEGLAPVDPAKQGTLEDPTSERRLKLIWDTQMEQAQEFARWKAEQDPDVLDAFPAQEFLRIESRRVPRQDWPRRWAKAGGKVFNGRMIALKNDPVWVKLSRFGTPWPPFDFGSGMGLRDIRRKEAEELGLIKPGERPAPMEKKFNEHLEASVKDLSPRFRRALKTIFGDQIELKGETAFWSGVSTEREPKPEPPPAPENRSTTAAFVPAGSPVANAAQVQTRTKADARRVNATLAAIDNVHGDGPLKAIPFDNKVSRGADGTYWSTATGAKRVGVRKGMEGMESHLAHEIGHWIDHIGIASPGRFASESAPELEPWRKAVKQSAAFQSLLQDRTLPARYRAYATSLREVWARSYAQFVAEEGNPANAASVAARAWHQKVRDGKTNYPSAAQWEATDFEPVREEIRKLFVQMGWMQVNPQPGP